jgi:hypothetical protein
MPVQSLLCNPPQNSIIGAKGATDISLKGVAWSGGGRKVERVDVSTDGGDNWTAAELFKPIEQRRNRHWAWTQFNMVLPLTDEVQARLRKGEKVKLDLVSKALNSDFNTQPERMEPYWNARGVCINHWYHVKVTLDPSKEKGVIEMDATVGSDEKEFPNTPTGGTFHKPWGLSGWTIDGEHNDDAHFKTKKGGDTYHKEQGQKKE